MQTNTSRTSPAPGASPTAINAQDAPMKGSDVLQIPLVELLARNPAMRIDWDRKTLAFEFNFNDPNGNADAVNEAAQCIQNLYGVPDGASRQTILVQSNRIDPNAANDNCDNGPPRPCEIHEAQNARASGAAGSGTSTGTSIPRGIRPLPRRNQILNGSGGGAQTAASPNPNTSPSTTQAGATYDNTNTPRASSDDDNDDDVPLDVLKKEVAARRKRKARAAAAIFEPVIKKEPVEKEPGKRLHPERCQFKIRGLKEHVRWYYTKSIRPIDAVPAGLLKPRYESLYVHRYKSPFPGRQIWIYIKSEQAQAGAGDAGADAVGSTRNRDGNGGGNEGEGEGRQAGEWRRVEIGDPHPRLEGLVLHMLDGNEPRWVKPKSARSYASGKHKRARWARSM